MAALNKCNSDGERKGMDLGTDLDNVEWTDKEREEETDQKKVKEGLREVWRDGSGEG